MNAADSLPSDQAPPRSHARHRLPSTSPAWHWPCLLFFVLLFAGRLLLTISGRDLPPAWRWADGLFWVSTAATCVASLARWLPAQNAAAAGTMLLAFAAIMELMGARTHFPFGSYDYTTRMGYLLIDSVAWPILFYWVAALLCCRGIARLILRPWRRASHYGFLLILLAALLSTWLSLSAEPFFAQVAVYKTWQTSGARWTWHSVPWTFFLAWWVLSVLALAMVSPWLIVKSPIKSPPDSHSLYVWLMLEGLFLVGCILWQCFAAALASLLGLGFVSWLAIRGRKSATPLPTAEGPLPKA